MPTTVPASVAGATSLRVAVRPSEVAGAPKRMVFARPKSRIFTAPITHNENVVGFQVAVRNVLAVGSGKAMRNLDSVVHCFAVGDRAPRQYLPKTVALQESSETRKGARSCWPMS